MSKRAKLHIIRGGKLRGGNGNPPKTGGGRGKKPRRPNPLNKLLWYATSRAYYPNRATGVEMIAERMTKLSKRIEGRQINVSTSTASIVIDDGRRRCQFYGWMLMNVEKGSLGWNRGYVPILSDVDSDGFELFLIDDDDLSFAISGLQSALHTQASMITTTANGVSFLTNCLEALGSKKDADNLREFAAECRSFARRAAEIRVHADAL
jgi:hypothetical protein